MEEKAFWETQGAQRERRGPVAILWVPVLLRAGTMHERRDTSEEVKSVRERLGERRIFGGGVVAALAIGTLTIIVWRVRRRATTDAVEESHEPTRERVGQVPEQSIFDDTDSSSERGNDDLRPGAERAQQDEEATFQREELIERAEEISGEPARRSHGGEATEPTSETEQEVRHYLEGVEYPASKDDLVSAAKSNSAPEELIRKLVDLTIKDYSSSEEVAVAVDSRRGSDR